MSGHDAIRCTKNFPHPDGDQATELLLIRRPDESRMDAYARCAEHPAADDIPLLRRMSPSLICVIVPLKPKETKP